MIVSDKKTTEELIIRFEAELNESMDRFFAARPHLERTKDNEFLFYSGFRMAYYNVKAQ